MMANAEKEVIDRFLVSIGDYANKIDYVAGQAEISEEIAPETIGIIRDYTKKIIDLADRFDLWIEGEAGSTKKPD